MQRDVTVPLLVLLAGGGAGLAGDGWGRGWMRCRVVFESAKRVRTAGSTSGATIFLSQFVALSMENELQIWCKFATSRDSHKFRN